MWVDMTSKWVDSLTMPVDFVSLLFCKNGLMYGAYRYSVGSLTRSHSAALTIVYVVVGLQMPANFDVEMARPQPSTI